MSKTFLILSMLAVAFSLVSCKTEEGKTLAVDITGQLPGTVLATGSTGTTITGSVRYRGTDTDLIYTWDVVSAPAGAAVGFDPRTFSTLTTNPLVQPSTKLTFSTPGTYLISLTVQEMHGNISASNSAAFVVVASSGG